MADTGLVILRVLLVHGWQQYPLSNNKSNYQFSQMPKAISHEPSPTPIDNTNLYSLCHVPKQVHYKMPNLQPITAISIYNRQKMPRHKICRNVHQNLSTAGLVAVCWLETANRSRTCSRRSIWTSPLPEWNSLSEEGIPTSTPSPTYTGSSRKNPIVKHRQTVYSLSLNDHFGRGNIFNNSKPITDDFAFQMGLDHFLIK